MTATVIIAACDGANREESAVLEILPLSDSTPATSDSVASRLLSRQLALLRALTLQKEQAGLYLSPEFKLLDHRSPDGEALDYFQTLARQFTPDELEPEQHEIRESHAGAGVVITHMKRGPPVFTRWEEARGEWKAVFMMIDPPPEILELATGRR